MQTEGTTLPTVSLNSRFPREQNPDIRISQEGKKSHPPCKSAAFIFPSRKQLHPLHGSPYGNSAKCYLQPDPLKQASKSAVGQRVVSAKMLRIKDLQNQLADAHYHLNELSSENRLLKVLQKRQDSALRQYEGTNAELPRIINSHHEELRILQSKYNKLRARYKSTCEMLKDKENELHSVQTQNKHLLKLSKDRHLGEREKLQIQVSDLNYRIEQQDQTIRTLNRKLAIETKYLKHQLHLEIMKQKETQKHFQEALEKLKTAEDLLGNKEKRLLSKNQLNVMNKGKSVQSQSLTNLQDKSMAFNLQKSGNKPKRPQNEVQDKTPSIMKNTNNEESKDDKVNTIVLNLEVDQPSSLLKTETMASLQHVRNFRLQKSSHDSTISSENKLNDFPAVESEKDCISPHFSPPVQLKDTREDLQRYNRYHSTNEHKDSDPIFEKKEKSSTTLLEGVGEYKFLSGNTSEDEIKSVSRDFDTMLLASKSRELYARLIGNSDDNFEIVKDSLNLESKTDSLAIEDIDKLINKQLRLNQVLDASESLETFVEPEKYATVSIESDLELKRNLETRNHPSKIPLLNVQSNSSRHKKTPVKSELFDNVQNKTQINGYEIEHQDQSFNENEVFKHTNSLQSIIDISMEERNTELRSSMSMNELQILSKSVDNLENVDVVSSEERRLTIKHSISEESEPDKLESIDTEMQDECANTSENAKKNKDLNHTHKNDCESEFENNELSVADTKLNYNKEKLLAAMKAIDDNENIEFVDNDSRKNSISNRSQITENLYRGLPSHSRKKEIIRDLFEDSKVNKPKGGCSKLH